MSNPSVNLRTFSEQQKLYPTYENTIAPQAASPAAVDNKETKNSDTITFAGKQINKKKAIAGGAALITTAALLALAVAKRKDISSSLQTMKFKLAKPEAVVIPEKGYDLGKEAENVLYKTYKSASGYSDYITDSLGNVNANPAIAEIPQDVARLQNLGSNGNKLDIGITDDGHAFVHIGSVGQVTNHPDYHKTPTLDRIAAFLLVSDSAEFTPAQKNLIALIQQGKLGSEHSPFGELADDIIGADPTKGSILEAVAKWAKDIDTTDVETQKILGRLSKLKGGQTIGVDMLAKCEPPISYRQL